MLQDSAEDISFVVKEAFLIPDYLREVDYKDWALLTLKTSRGTILTTSLYVLPLALRVV